MRQGFRWFGSKDPISLKEIRQAGVTDLVTALYHLPCGSLWTKKEIQKTQHLIEKDRAGRPTGLRWTLVESLPIHEQIKTRSAKAAYYTEIYRESLRNLADCGIKIVCYNWMPILDWTRTDLDWELPDGSRTLLYDGDAFTAFDLYLLKRKNATQDYTSAEVKAAEKLFRSLSPSGKKNLTRSILMGLPGTVKDLTIPEFRELLKTYADIDDRQLRDNYYTFLNEIAPLCEQLGILLAVHPDDPPRSIFGLPRIMSTAADVRQMFREVPSVCSGLTLCTGSFAGRQDNDLVQMAKEFAPRVYFAHLRNVTYLPGKKNSFYESGQLEGWVDMVGVVKALMKEEVRRQRANLPESQIIFRPDHGRLLESDLSTNFYGGYSRLGRMIGLAELRGLETGLKRCK